MVHLGKRSGTGRAALREELDRSLSPTRPDGYASRPDSRYVPDVATTGTSFLATEFRRGGPADGRVVARKATCPSGNTLTMEAK